MHRRAQWNHLGDDYEELCSCGAHRTSVDGKWTGGDPWERRPASDAPPWTPSSWGGGGGGFDIGGFFGDGGG
jgi:hypothetical protein